MKTAIGYVRVSTEEQAVSGLGLEAQRERIRAFCADKGLKLADDAVFEDPGQSGGKPLESRPAGARFLAAARKGKKPVVVVAKLDRLFRSVVDAAVTIEEFDKKGIRLVALAEGFDMTSPYGKAMAQMASVFAELERAMIRQRTKDAMKVKRFRRERSSRHAPYGWDFGREITIQKGDKQIATRELIENAKEQEVIGLMKSLRAAGKSYPAIAAELNTRNIPTKRGAKPWIHSTVVGILARAA